MERWGSPLSGLPAWPGVQVTPARRGCRIKNYGRWNVPVANPGAETHDDHGLMGAGSRHGARIPGLAPEDGGDSVGRFLAVGGAAFAKLSAWHVQFKGPDRGRCALLLASASPARAQTATLSLRRQTRAPLRE